MYGKNAQFVAVTLVSVGVAVFVETPTRIVLPAAVGAVKEHASDVPVVALGHAVADAPRNAIDAQVGQATRNKKIQIRFIGERASSM
jgi:hypothetical protein